MMEGRSCRHRHLKRQHVKRQHQKRQHSKHRTRSPLSPSSPLSTLTSPSVIHTLKKPAVSRPVLIDPADGSTLQRNVPFVTSPFVPAPSVFAALRHWRDGTEPPPP